MTANTALPMSRNCSRQFTSSAPVILTEIPADKSCYSYPYFKYGKIEAQRVILIRYIASNI